MVTTDVCLQQGARRRVPGALGGSGVPDRYERLAGTYDDNWVYSPDCVRWMAARIATALDLQPIDRMADIGCGTGLFAREVAGIVVPRHPLRCVDPSAAMLKQIAARQASCQSRRPPRTLPNGESGCHPCSWMRHG
jgi:SAM-dependent methyltransferase